MRIPLSMIKPFIQLDGVSPSQISDALTLLGIEVDAILDPQAQDPIFELSLTPNLGHCLSALGIARELGAALQKPVAREKISPSERGGKLNLEVAVRDPQLCPRYMCRRIEGVAIAPSPPWLQHALLACGLKPIHNAVDIANYIMMKVGQPLHCFDADLLKGKIEVAPAKTPQKFLGLDEHEREIVPGTLLISDAEKAVAIAGVIGGANTAVSASTKNILLESAFFDPMTIRRGAKAAGLRTDSAIRFEKGVDPNGVEEALDEAAHLLAEICGGKVSQGKIDLKKHPFPPKRILCREARVNQLLGTKLSNTEIEEIFHRLGFKTDPAKEDSLNVHVPQYRFDISEEIDLIEEVARIYGYNHIEKREPRCVPSQIPNDPVYLFETTLRRKCSALGLQEFLTSDLISPKLAALALESASPQISLLQALHPKTEEYSILRPSLLPGLLQVAKGNIDRKSPTFSAFEIGRVHFLLKGENIEIPTIAFILTGKSGPSSWDTKPAEVDFYDLKGLLEELFEALSITHTSFQPSQHLSFHPGRQANIHSNNLTIGSFGEVHPTILGKLDIKQRVLFAELNLLHLMSLHRPHPQMTPLPQFPSSERDLTLSLPLDTLIESIFEKVRSVPSPILEKVELIDLYQPEHATQKNATFRFTYRDRSKTISFEEIEAEHAKLIARVSPSL